jgi:hypothetical protein
MARKQFEEEKPVRKSVLIIGAVALGAAILGFVLMNFVFGGSDNVAPLPSTPTVPGVAAPVATPTPIPVNNEETSGGRDPFSGPQGLAAVTTPAPAAPTASTAPASASTQTLASAQVTPHFTLNVVKVTGDSADLKFDDKSITGVHAGDKLPDGVVVQKVGDGCASFDQGGQVFSVCQGQTVKR